MQHALAGGNMSGCNMLEQATTCPATTCLNRQKHVRVQHARTGGNMSGCNMLEQATTSFLNTFISIFIIFIPCYRSPPPYDHNVNEYEQFFRI
jgi:hypothetical protein